MITISWYIDKEFAGCEGYAVVDEDAKELVACCASADEAIATLAVLVKADEIEDAAEESDTEDSCDCGCPACCDNVVQDFQMGKATWMTSMLPTTNKRIQ